MARDWNKFLRDFKAGGKFKLKKIGGSDDMTLRGTRKDDILEGGIGNDVLRGGRGNDELFGGAGNDRMGGGSGDDYLNGGAGSDRVNGGRGNDTLVYVYGENLGAADRYSGGRGVDTLRLEFTAEEWNDLNSLGNDLVGELREFLDFMAARIDPRSGEAGRGRFEFESFDLKAARFEKLEVIVDGVAVDVTNNLVITQDDLAKTLAGSDVTINVLDNDEVLDGVSTVRVVEGPEAGRVSVDADNNIVFDTNGDFSALAEGEVRQVNFTYEVEDANGDTALSTVSVDVTGINDGPQAENVAVTISENDSEVEEFAADADTPQVQNSGAFYVLDYDSGTLTSVKRTTGSLTFEEVAPANGAILHLNPNTNGWTLSAASVSDGTVALIDPTAISLTGYSGGSFVDADILYLQDVATGVDINLSVGDIMTPDGLADMSISLTGVNYDGSDGLIVADVAGASGSVAPSATANLATGAVIINAVASDIDTSDVLTYSVDDTGLLGSVINNGDGTFTYSQDNQFGHLSVGQTAIETFTYTVDDGNGGSATATATITVEGENDDPDAQALEGEVIARGDGVPGFETQVGPGIAGNAGLWFVTDYATGETNTVVRTTGALTFEDVAPQNGAVVQINANTSNWFIEAATFTNGVRSNIDAEGFQVSGYDGASLIYNGALYLTEAGSDIGISFTAPDVETPDGTADFNFAFDGLSYQGAGGPIEVSLESATVSVPRTAADTDLLLVAQAFDRDAADVLTYSIDDSQTLGSVTDNGDGTFLYSTAGNFDDLLLGESFTDTFTYTADDGNGGSDTEVVSILVNGIGTEMSSDDFMIG